MGVTDMIIIECDEKDLHIYISVCGTVLIDCHECSVSYTQTNSESST